MIVEHQFWRFHHTRLFVITITFALPQRRPTSQSEQSARPIFSVNVYISRAFLSNQYTPRPRDLTAPRPRRASPVITPELRKNAAHPRAAACAAAHPRNRFPLEHQDGWSPIPKSCLLPRACQRSKTSLKPPLWRPCAPPQSRKMARFTASFARAVPRRLACDGVLSAARPSLSRNCAQKSA